MQNFVQNIIDEIIDQYMFADSSKRPWIIGFSGGKDSTAMLQLVWEALLQTEDWSIQKRQAISNIKEFPKGELFEIKQFYNIE